MNNKKNLRGLRYLIFLGLCGICSLVIIAILMPKPTDLNDISAMMTLDERVSVSLTEAYKPSVTNIKTATEATKIVSATFALSTFTSIPNTLIPESTQVSSTKIPPTATKKATVYKTPRPTNIPTATLIPPTAIPTIPAAPTNLVASFACEVLGGKITLEWQDNADNEVNYILRGRIGEGGTIQEYAILGADITSYTLSGNYSYTTSLEYLFMVAAWNYVGYSDWETIQGTAIYPCGP